MTDSTPTPNNPAVTVSLQELKHGTVSLDTLEQAFGPASLGIIIVKDLPTEFPALRSRVLSYSSYLANLAPSELEKVERPLAKYSVGWSCGKEKLANGRYDTLKGSYYAQPIHDAALEAQARALYPNVPEMTSPNVWPAEDVLPGFADTFETLCRLIVDIAGLVARSCDRYGVAKIPDYKPDTLERIVRTSIATKARLLHYFPPPPSASSSPPEPRPDSGVETAPDDDWCGTHLDLGALTGLTSQMFVDEAAHSPSLPTAANNHTTPPPTLPELPAHPDPNCGLWIRDRTNALVQVHIPSDCLAFQTGEALELLTQGRFRAVPHFVRGAKSSLTGPGSRIARNTLAVFTQPNLWEKVDEQRDFARFAQEVLGRGL